MTGTTFVEFVLDQLSALSNLRATGMFGGHGLYADGTFFAILMDGRLYFKTDEASRSEYLVRGMQPFVYEKARRTMTMQYFEVPSDVLESRAELVNWATRAIRAAEKKKD